MEKTQIKTNLDHRFNLALRCLWTILIQPYMHAKNLIYKIYVETKISCMHEVSFSAICTWCMFRF